MALATLLKFNTDMKIAFFHNNKKRYVYYFLSLTFIVFLLWQFFMQNDADLGNGYEFVSGRGDDLHIRKNGNIIIDSAIIDLAVTGSYIVGLRLPAEHLECHGGYKIRLTNQKRYFILPTDTGEILHFDSVDAFNTTLENLSIRKDIFLDYSKLESTWVQYAAYYENIDFSSCEVISHR